MRGSAFTLRAVPFGCRGLRRGGAGTNEASADEDQASDGRRSRVLEHVSKKNTHHVNEPSQPPSIPVVPGIRIVAVLVMVSADGRRSSSEGQARPKPQNAAA